MPFSNFLNKSLENFLKNVLEIAFFVQTRKTITSPLLNFLKNMLNYTLLAIFLINFLKLFKISQLFAFFVQTLEKFTHGLLNSSEKCVKIMHF